MQIFASGHRRRLALAFLVAGVPCLLLLIIASQMLEQERELLANREGERQAQFVSALAERMRQRLDRVRLELSAGLAPEPAPALVAAREGDSLRLPWESAGSFAAWPESPAVRRAIDQGEREEFGSRNPSFAAVYYRRAMIAGTDEAGRAYAQLLLARALQRQGLDDEALENYRQIARLDPAVRDDQQIPLGLYALERLASADESDLEALLEPYLDASVELSSTALHMMEGIASRIGAPAVAETITDRLLRIDRGIQLRRDVRFILPSSRAADGRWVPYGEWLWLVGSGRIADEEVVIAVAGEDLIRSMVADDPSLEGLDLVSGYADGSIPAGPALAGLSLRLPNFPPPEDETALARRNFFYAALGFVLVTSLIASGLLLRDIRRETEMVELRSQFVSSVSHELKTPLSAIRMFAESLQMGRPSTSERREQYLDVIVNESERLSRLLDNVLEFSKIERGERRYDLHSRDLTEVVRRALRGAAYPLQQKGFQLALHIEENLPAVRVDEDAIEQALLNLLTNAMKYSGESRDLGVRVERAGDHVALRVIDHGIGVPSQETEKIFEKFYRATNSEGVTGAGLGLAIVAHIARSHGGLLRIESQPGRGSEFTMALPVEGR